jgi:hypothetical protein
MRVLSLVLLLVCLVALVWTLTPQMVPPWREPSFAIKLTRNDMTVIGQAVVTASRARPLAFAALLSGWGGPTNGFTIYVQRRPDELGDIRWHDQWGQPYQFAWSTATPERLLIWSSGRNRINEWASGDDIVLEFPVVNVTSRVDRASGP